MTPKTYKLLLVEVDGNVESAMRGYNWWCSQPMSLRNSIKTTAVIKFIMDNQYIW